VTVILDSLKKPPDFFEFFVQYNVESMFEGLFVWDTDYGSSLSGSVRWIV